MNNLYELTGNINDINTLLINRNVYHVESYNQALTDVVLLIEQDKYPKNDTEYQQHYNAGIDLLIQKILTLKK
jgi:Mn-containing catalase